MSIKQISVDQLEPGMYVHDLNIDWMSHPFLRTKFPVKTEKEIVKIRDSGVRLLYIDTERGRDVKDAKTEQEVHNEVLVEMMSVAEGPAPVIETKSFFSELPAAKNVQKAAHQVVREFMRDARLGQQVNIEKVEPIVEQMTESILRNDGALLSLCLLKDADDYTFLHSVSVGALMISFTRFLGMAPQEIREAGVAGMLHDIGKMKVPLSVLNKPGRLTDSEFAKMRQHPEIGLEILKETEGISNVSLNVCIQHHERVDGSGYPYKLKVDEISYEGQISAICDVYDAITSDRCYHKGMAPTDALRKLFEWSKFHFNPKLVQAFTRCIGIYPVGSLVRLESGRLAVVMQQNDGSLLNPVVRVIFDTNKGVSVTPYEVDLSRSMGHGGADKVLNHESPEKWSIDPSLYS